MSELTLPNVPTNAVPAKREAECDAAIRNLNEQANLTRRDIEAATSQKLPKAASALRAELKTIEDRKAEIIVARLQAIVEGATAEAGSWEPKAAEALPAFEEAQAEFKAAEQKLKAAKRAYEWPRDRKLMA